MISMGTVDPIRNPHRNIIEGRGRRTSKLQADGTEVAKGGEGTRMEYPGRFPKVRQAVPFHMRGASVQRSWLDKSHHPTTRGFQGSHTLVPVRLLSGVWFAP